MEFSYNPKLGREGLRAERIKDNREGKEEMLLVRTMIKEEKRCKVEGN